MCTPLYIFGVRHAPKKGYRCNNPKIKWEYILWICHLLGVWNIFLHTNMEFSFLVGDTNSRAELAKLTYFGSNFDNHKNYGTPFRTNDKV
jgi:hypothetical protein